MSHLKDHPASQTIAANGLDFPPRIQRRLSLAACSMLFLAADAATALLAQAIIAGTEFLFTRPDTATPPIDPDYFTIAPVILGVVITYLALRGRYTARTPFWTETGQLFAASAWACAALLLALTLSPDGSRQLPALATIAAFPFLATPANALTKSLLVQIGAWRLPILLVGRGDTALAAEAALTSDPALGYSIAARIDPDRIITLSNSSFLSTLLERHHAAQILFASDSSDLPLQRQLVDAALRDKVPFAILPAPQAIPALPWHTTRFLSHDLLMLSLRHGLSRATAQAAKTAIDLAAASLLLLLASPIFLLAALFNLFSDGPLFFVHHRLGSGGRLFPCLKFRTMVVNGDRVLEDAFARNPALRTEWDTTQKLRNDPRVTPFGCFLRKTSLDELPQLINVLRRQMSLVGPRPIVPSEARFYGENIAHYFNAKPGVTGLWQVSGRSNTTYDRRVQLDVWYVNNWSLALDIALILKTIPAVLSRSGAH